MLKGGPDDDTLFGGLSVAIGDVSGSRFGDLIRGDDRDNVLRLGRGGDRGLGKGGADRLLGGPGGDELDGGAGSNVVSAATA